jgi:hypothetical protein
MQRWDVAFLIHRGHDNTQSRPVGSLAAGRDLSTVSE